MEDLIVVGFAGNTQRANGVLDELRVLDDAWILQMEDAVAVHRAESGKLVMDQSYRPTGKEGAEWGGALGLLIGAILAIPFTAGASAAVAAGALAAGALSGVALGATTGAMDAAFWKDELGVPEDFVRQVSSLVEPGSSAIFAVLHADQSEQVVARFQGYGGKVLRTTLTEDHKRRIAAALHGSI
ncbi:MAG TPA: DUF1269 domain-containing protein [Acidobacteriaceae bacterium]|nr:DUF1269 domain-containing protein [Acidobacteriaceae bacterium]